MGDGEENLSRCKKDYNVDDILERDVKSGSPVKIKKNNNIASLAFHYREEEGGRRREGQTR